jgi:hypothetical protein
MRIATYNVNGINGRLGLIVGCLYLPNGNCGSGRRIQHR